MAVRITKKEQAEIQRLNKNARAKLKRIENRYGIREDIRVKAPKTFTSRKELNAYKKNLRDFTNRYNQRYQYVKTDEGAVTRDVYNELKRKVKDVNHLRAQEYKRLKNIPVTVAGEPIPGYDVALRAEIRFRERGSLYEQFKPIKLNINTFSSPEQARRYLTRLEEHKSIIPKLKQLYQDNYVLALERHFGERLSADLVEQIKKMPNGTFMQKVALSDEFGEIKTIYGLNELVQYHNQLLSFFEQVNDGD